MGGGQFREALLQVASVRMRAGILRANQDTITAYGRYGIRVSQNGARALVPPHFDGNEVLEVYRTVDLEPAVAENFSLKACLKAADCALALGLPAIVSVHSINFHSSVKDYRSRRSTRSINF